LRFEKGSGRPMDNPYREMLTGPAGRSVVGCNVPPAEVTLLLELPPTPALALAWRGHLFAGCGSNPQDA